MITDTSLEAYAGLDLNYREGLVLDALDAYTAANPGKWPTGYELEQVMEADGTAHDVNGTRPRLSDLKKRGVVEKFGKRRCSVTGNTAYQWRRVA